MKDDGIIDLYWARSEEAISETDRKYGKYCRRIADNILNDMQDSEECVSDTYLKAWNAMPPQRPTRLSVFLGTITRNLALDKYRLGRAEKRGGGELVLALEELWECAAGAGGEEQLVEGMVVTQVLNCFLASLSRENRIIFLRRYWYVCSVKEIADGMRLSESKVKMSLLRSRNKLREMLEKEGISV
ncbi:MAG: RNA polymerase sigma factor [Oscillospiraceae bacterium]|nr:RNA polymerase sigma factor [Oscillospiraceae bacterium]